MKAPFLTLSLFLVMGCDQLSMPPMGIKEIPKNGISNDTEMAQYENELHVACQQYDNAINEIQKSVIYNERQLKLPEFISNVRGKISISTSRGGYSTNINLSVNKGWIGSGSRTIIHSDVYSGSKSYTKISSIMEGDCVIFSVVSLKVERTFTERGEVCDPDFTGEVVSVEPCQIT